MKILLHGNNPQKATFSSELVEINDRQYIIILLTEINERVDNVVVLLKCMFLF